jgi:hypothetical protein
MAKRKKRPPKPKQQVLSRPQINITGEVSYIIERAQQRDARVVSLASLVFFSTDTGDAWMLDPADNFALCLARDGQPQPFTITETASQFAIEWQATYQIDGDLFVVLEHSGQSRSITGYPIRELKRFIRRATK